MAPIDLDHQITPCSALAAAEQKLSQIRSQELFAQYTAAVDTLHAAFAATEEDAFFFANGHGEAIASLFLGHLAASMKGSGKLEIVTAGSSPEIQQGCWWAEQFGAQGKEVANDQQGQVDLQQLKQALTPRVGLVSLPAASGLTGVLQPLAEVMELCRQRHIPLHLDISAVCGKIEMPLSELDFSYLTFCGSQLPGPPRAAGLWVRDQPEWPGLLSANVSLPGVCLLAQALQQGNARLDHYAIAAARRQQLEQRLQAEIPAAQLLFATAPRLPHCCCLAFPGAHQEALLYLLDRRGVIASSGGGNVPPLAALLRSCGVASELAETALSFALAPQIGKQEIETAVAIIADSVAQLRRSSGYAA